MASIPIAAGVNSPHENDLRTGDLLFPRSPIPAADQLEMLLETSLPLLLNPDKSIADVLGVRPVEERSRGMPGYEITRVAERPQFFIESARSGVFDPNRPEHLMLLLKILDATFGELTMDWLNMTVRQFIQHPIARILIDAINKDLGNGFFVGHCALVLREQAGHDANAGRAYVIEANITDFSHYRVSIHPYSETNGAEPTSGWVNFRCGLGQQVWHARPAALDRDLPAAAAMRSAIVTWAKTLLGRPYGFFDNPALGETDRLYCSEFVYSVFSKADSMQLDVGDHRSWRWLLENMPDPARTQLEDELRSGDGRLYQWVITRPFFLLTVQMLWRSARLVAKHKPGGVEYA
jgi:hypothetical protein